MAMSASLAEVSAKDGSFNGTEHSSGKVLRDGQGQASDRRDEEVLDLIITNALVIDWTGIFKVRPRRTPARKHLADLREFRRISESSMVRSLESVKREIQILWMGSRRV
jgi:hypothetical protein